MIITHISILDPCVQTCLPTRQWTLGGQESLLFFLYLLGLEHGERSIDINCLELEVELTPSPKDKLKRFY